MSYGTLSLDSITTSTGQVIGASSASTMKNRIINGDMRIDQRNAGAVYSFGSAVSGFSLDRMACNNQSGGATITVQQSSSAPAGFQNSLAVVVTTGTTLSGSSYARLYQGFEGYNMSDLGWGTAAAKTVTLSFWVQSSIAGTHSMILQNYAATQAYAITYNISTANTWTYCTANVPGCTTGTWGTNNNCWGYLSINLGSATSQQITSGSWTTISSYVNGSPGSVNLAATTGATWNITGLQLEVGSQATTFDFRHYQQELALCQRYFQKSYDQGTAQGTSTWYGAVDSYLGSATTNPNAFPVLFRVEMRGAPTITLWDATGGGTPHIGTVYKGAYNQTGSALNPCSSGFVGYCNTSQSSAEIGFQWTAAAEL